MGRPAGRNLRASAGIDQARRGTPGSSAPSGPLPRSLRGQTVVFRHRQSAQAVPAGKIAAYIVSPSALALLTISTLDISSEEDMHACSFIGRSCRHYFALLIVDHFGGVPPENGEIPAVKRGRVEIILKPCSRMLKQRVVARKGFSASEPSAWP